MLADQEILKILLLMSDLEFRVSELYAEGAGQYAENRQSWSGLSRAEVGHGEAIKKMAALYAERPEEYRAVFQEITGLLCGSRRDFCRFRAEAAAVRLHFQDVTGLHGNLHGIGKGFS